MRSLLYLTVFSLFLLLSCDEVGGTQIRIKNETEQTLTDITYAFGFTEEEARVNRIAPGRASGYRQFENADRCSGWRLQGTFAGGEELNKGIALCAIAAPIPPGRYSVLVQRETFIVDGEERTFIRTEIVED